MGRNPLTQLASLGEDVIGKASQNPTASRFLQGAVQLRDRVDDLSKRVRGLEQMEKQIAELEKRVAKLEGGTGRKPAAASKTTPAKPKPDAAKPDAAKKETS